MSNWQLVVGRHFNMLPQKTVGEKRLRLKFNREMSLSRKNNKHLSPPVKHAELDDWLS